MPQRSPSATSVFQAGLSQAAPTRIPSPGALRVLQNRRGGRVKLAHITAPQSEFGDPKRSDVLHAMELALSFEKLNFQKLRELHDTADKHGDAQMADFVEDMLTEQVGSG